MGCGGGQSSSDKAQMELVLATADLSIATEVAQAAQDGSDDLEGATDGYIEALREYDDELGDEEVRRRLADTASDVAPYCPLCADELDRERANYE